MLNIRTALVRQVGVTWRSEFEIATIRAEEKELSEPRALRVFGLFGAAALYPAPFWFRFRLHVQNARLGSAPAVDPGNVLASVHRLEGQDVPSGGRLAAEQPACSRWAAVSRSRRST